MLGTYALSSGYYDAYYKKAQQVRTLIQNEFADSFKRFDVLLTPTTPTTAFEFGEKADPVSMYMGDICTVATNIAGLPAINVPAGLDRCGKPVGIQLIAAPFREQTLLRCAYTYEQTAGFGFLQPAFKERR